MAKTPTDIREEIERAAEAAQTEFADLSDYIWKSVRLIEHETRLELRKLKAYFTGRPDMQEFRWRHESRKLQATFPFFIAQGNLLSATTLFEVRLLVLAKTIEPLATLKLANVRAQGAERSFLFFEALGIPRARVPKWEQVSAALTIRNCVVHAGGALQYSRDAAQLRRIVRERRFWTPDVRERVRRRGTARSEVTLFEHPLLGERIVITNDYAHWVTSVLRDYFLNLCSSLTGRLLTDGSDGAPLKDERSGT